jgi:hypothetical protein
MAARCQALRARAAARARETALLFKSILGDCPLVTGCCRFRQRRSECAGTNEPNWSAYLQTESMDCVMDPMLEIVILLAFAFAGLMGCLANRA